MASFTLSGIGVSEIRNKLGDLVYTRNRGGQTVRSFVVPTNTASAHRTNARNNFATAVSLWAALSDEEVIQWNMFAQRFTKRNSIAQAYRPTGRNMFIECNVNLIAAGLFPISTPVFNQMPGIVSAGRVIDLSSSDVVVSVSLVGSPTLLHTGNVLCVSASPSVSAGINYPKNFFQPIQVFPEGTDLSSIDLFSDYVANYGSPVSALKVFFKVWCVDVLSGIRCKPLIFSAVVG